MNKMNLDKMCLYDFYERGYWDAICFSYILIGMSKEQTTAWFTGLQDGKAGCHKDILEFEKSFAKG